MRIIQISDLHVMVDPLAEVRDICTRARFDKVWAAVRREQPEATLLIVTGDLTHDEKLETYQTLRQQFADWIPKLRIVPGNHDDREIMRQVFADRIQVVAGRNTFVETVGGWRLIGLDSHVPGKLHGELGSAQLEWLEQQLALGPEQPVGLFLHHPPINVNSPWMDAIKLVDADALLSLVQRYPAVRIISCGHLHHERSEFAGALSFFITPSTGVQFRPETEKLEVDTVNPGYRVFDLFPDGRFQTRVERVPCT